MPDFRITPITRSGRVVDFTVHPLDDPRRDDAERLGCAACGKAACAHPDPIYAGAVPPIAEKPLFHSNGAIA